MGTKLRIRLFLPILILFFIALPGVSHAAEWWQFWTPFTDTLGALTRLIANVGVFILLIFTGIPVFYAIAAGIVYVAMAALAVIAGATILLIKPLIEATLSMSVAPGAATISVVNEGWQFTRDIVIMFFIAILAFIGLATIMRWRTYELQKTLPALIIMALLINFSGVFVGLVVDAANIFTYAFLKPIGAWDIISGPLGAAAGDLFNTITSIPTKIFAEDPLSFFASTFLQPVIGAATKAFFYFIFIIILLAIFFLFIIRLGMLWLLTILAPFAFAAYILPNTRNWWKQWLQQLIQWAFMGVPMTFFLLIGTRIASIPINTGVTSQDWFGNILISFIQPLMTMLFLIVGFGISVTFVPKGAQFVTQRAERGVTVATGTIARAAAQTTAASAKGGWGAFKGNLGQFQGDIGTFGVKRAALRAWGRRPDLIPSSTQLGAATTGVKSAVAASLGAGMRVILGKKRQGMKRCPNTACPRHSLPASIATSATTCPTCGYNF